MPKNWKRGPEPRYGKQVYRRICSMYAEGFTVAAISQTFKYTPTHIYKILRDHGVNPNYARDSQRRKPMMMVCPCCDEIIEFDRSPEAQARLVVALRKRERVEISQALVQPDPQITYRLHDEDCPWICPECQTVNTKTDHDCTNPVCDVNRWEYEE